jgi:F-type H+-transporting ATPase subunit b
VQIDWFTLVAQIVNFLILVVLLKVFLYGPIVRAMDEREAKIAARLRQAEEERANAEQEAQALNRERQELEARKDEFLERARAEAEKVQKELFHETREMVEHAQQRWWQAIEREREEFIQNLRQRVSRQAGEIARRALSELASVDLETRMIDIFIHRLQALNEEQKEAIGDSISSMDGRIWIRSAFEIPKPKRQDLVQTLEEHFTNGYTIEVEFELDPNLIAGIELQAHGHRLAWSVEDYLDSLEERLDTAFDEIARQELQNVG